MRNVGQMKKRLWQVAAGMSLAVAAMSMVGCASMEERALINDAIVAGAGFEVEYTAPMDGRVYYYDQTSKRILITKSLRQGEKFEIVTGPGEPQLQSILGAKARDARMLLYFRPEAYSPNYSSQLGSQGSSY
ncbi:hypothetical protein JD969_11840 [Planctomycetota bacterium]|nr:hypothetical protein JD969_11840 [Planctomycetota bacterium]